MSLDGLLFLLLSGCVLLARWGDHQARQLRAGSLLVAAVTTTYVS